MFATGTDGLGDATVKTCANNLLVKESAKNSNTISIVLTVPTLFI